MILVGTFEHRPWTPWGAVFAAFAIEVLSVLFSWLITECIPRSFYFLIYPGLSNEELVWAQFATAWIVWTLAIIGILAATTTARKIYPDVFLFVRPKHPVALTAWTVLGLFVVLHGFDWVLVYLDPEQAAADVAIFDYMLFAPFRWIVIVNLVLIGPLAEELLFRGMLFPVLAKSILGVSGSAILTSAVFAMVHYYSWFGTLSVFASGLAFCLLRHVTGSLWPPLALHIAFNLAFWVETLLLVDPPYR